MKCDTDRQRDKIWRGPFTFGGSGIIMIFIHCIYLQHPIFGFDLFLIIGSSDASPVWKWHAGSKDKDASWRIVLYCVSCTHTFSPELPFKVTFSRCQLAPYAPVRVKDNDDDDDQLHRISKFKFCWLTKKVYSISLVQHFCFNSNESK